MFNFNPMFSKTLLIVKFLIIILFFLFSSCQTTKQLLVIREVANLETALQVRSKKIVDSLRYSGIDTVICYSAFIGKTTHKWINPVYIFYRQKQKTNYINLYYHTTNYRVQTSIVEYFFNFYFINQQKIQKFEIEGDFSANNQIEIYTKDEVNIIKASVSCRKYLNPITQKLFLLIESSIYNGY